MLTFALWSQRICITAPKGFAFAKAHAPNNMRSIVDVIDLSPRRFCRISPPPSCQPTSTWTFFYYVWIFVSFFHLFSPCLIVSFAKISSVHDETAVGAFIERWCFSKLFNKFWVAISFDFYKEGKTEKLWNQFSRLLSLQFLLFSWSVIFLLKTTETSVLLWEKEGLKRAG